MDVCFVYCYDIDAGTDSVIFESSSNTLLEMNGIDEKHRRREMSTR